MYRLISSFLQDEEAQGLVEYGIVLGLVSVVAITVLSRLGTNASANINNAGRKLTD